MGGKHLPQNEWQMKSAIHLTTLVTCVFGRSPILIATMSRRFAPQSLTYPVERPARPDFLAVLMFARSNVRCGS